jgi:hypothetical protein
MGRRPLSFWLPGGLPQPPELSPLDLLLPASALPLGVSALPELPLSNFPALLPCPLLPSVLLFPAGALPTPEPDLLAPGLLFFAKADETSLK